MGGGEIFRFQWAERAIEAAYELVRIDNPSCTATLGSRVNAPVEGRLWHGDSQSAFIDGPRCQDHMGYYHIVQSTGCMAAGG